MQYFPAYLRLEGRRCLVVGGGNVAARKANMLLAAGATITVVAPAIVARVRDLWAAGTVEWHEREFQETDLRDCWLVVDATGSDDAGRRIAAAAVEAGVFCNSVDSPSNCSFITPAIVDRDPIVIAVSSGGTAPAAHTGTTIRSSGGTIAMTDRWKVVATFGAMYEAEMAAGRLQSAGIDSRVDQRGAVGLFGPGHLGRSVRGIALLVHETRLDEAREALDIEPDDGGADDGTS